MRAMFADTRYLSAQIKRMDTDGDDTITELEFMQYMLTLQHKVSTEEFELLHSQFSELDKDNSGALTVADLKSEVRGLATTPADRSGA